MRNHVIGNHVSREIAVPTLGIFNNAMCFVANEWHIYFFIEEFFVCIISKFVHDKKKQKHAIVHVKNWHYIYVWKLVLWFRVMKVRVPKPGFRLPYLLTQCTVNLIFIYFALFDDFRWFRTLRNCQTYLKQ